MQVGAVIASILVSGLYHKFSSLSQPPTQMPPYQNWWYQYGIFGFGLPIVWAAFSLYLCNHNDVSDSIKFFVFWLGFLSFVVLAVLMMISRFRIL
jgi:hypothetical protein